MKHTYPFKSLILVIACTLLSCGSTETRPEINELRIDGNTLPIDTLLNHQQLRGLSIAVFEDHEIIWTGQWGIKSIQSEEPINEETVFSTASISKPVTALLAITLEEKGLIDLSKPVNDYLKRWTLPENEYTQRQAVTLNHLLSHTAGTSQHGFEDYYEGDELPSLSESLNGLIPGYDSPVEVLFEPGTSWKYSGGGYTLLQMALEDHFDKALHELANEHVFSPLKMERTSMIQPNETEFFDNVAKAHDENGNQIRTGIPITPQVAASGMWSTPSDMATLMIEIQKGMDGKSQHISKEVAEKLTDVVTIKVGGGWSHGFERFGFWGNRHWFSHNGANTGTGGYVYGTMNGGNGIAVFGNGPNQIREPIINAFRDTVISHYNWNRNLPEPTHTVSEKQKENIPGVYFNAQMGAELSVQFDNTGALTISPFFTGPSASGVYLGDGLFQFPNFPNLVTFKVDPNTQQFSMGLTRKGLNETDYLLIKRN